MATGKTELEDLVQKIEWEGGLWEYIMGYGGDMPDELKEETATLKAAAKTLDVKFMDLLAENGIDAF